MYVCLRVCGSLQRNLPLTNRTADDITLNCQYVPRIFFHKPLLSLALSANNTSYRMPTAGVSHRNTCILSSDLLRLCISFSTRQDNPPTQWWTHSFPHKQRDTSWPLIRHAVCCARGPLKPVDASGWECLLLSEPLGESLYIRSPLCWQIATFLHRGQCKVT